MSITDELRKWGYGFCGDTHDVVTAIADRIDAEHQKALDEWKAKHGQMWLKGYAECHAELLEGNETLASDLESCGWIRLPKDADGEYIHVGDVMEFEHRGEMLVAPVDTIELSRDHEGYLWSIMVDHQCVRYSMGGLEMRHHKPPTVEDVLQELVVDWDCAPDGEDKAAVLKEYATKLQLRGEDE